MTREREVGFNLQELSAKLISQLSFVALFFCVTLTIHLDSTEAGGLSKLLFPATAHLRFCYQPGDQANQQSAPLSTQCVFCARNQFEHTLFRCTGISAVQQSINTTQAFCIISQCLEQVRHQTPVLLG